MKLLRVGNKGDEFVAALDADSKIRDLSNHIKNLNPDTINFETLNKLKNLNLEELPVVDPKIRIGSCISNTIDFLAIGLNYKAVQVPHAD